MVPISTCAAREAATPTLMLIQNESSTNNNAAQNADLESLEEEVESEGAESVSTRKIAKFIDPTLHDDAIFEVFSRLPVKSVLKFKCLSKMWCSLMNSPLFTTTHQTRTLERPSDRSALLIIAHDRSNSKFDFLSGSYLGGSTTHLVTLPDITSDDTEVDHVNGLVLFRSENGYVDQNVFAFIINPSTREVFKLPTHPTQPELSDVDAHICYFLGFDPSKNEFKILYIQITESNEPEGETIECSLFNLSTLSWKPIDSTFPFDLLGDDWLFWTKKSLCIHGVIYIYFHASHVIAAFDLRTEKFSLFPIPQAAIPSAEATIYAHDEEFNYMVCNDPYLVDYNGSLAVICPEKVFIQNLIVMWILEDRDKQQWAKEIITIPADLGEGIDAPLPKVVICTGEIMFNPSFVSRETLKFPFYDVKRGSFRSMEIMVSPENFALDDVEVGGELGYIESLYGISKNRGM